MDCNWAESHVVHGKSRKTAVPFFHTSEHALARSQFPHLCAAVPMPASVGGLPSACALLCCDLKGSGFLFSSSHPLTVVHRACRSSRSEHLSLCPPYPRRTELGPWDVLVTGADLKARERHVLVPWCSALVGEIFYGLCFLSEAT